MNIGRFIFIILKSMCEEQIRAVYWCFLWGALKYINMYGSSPHKGSQSILFRGIIFVFGNLHILPSMLRHYKPNSIVIFNYRFCPRSSSVKFLGRLHELNANLLAKAALFTQAEVDLLSNQPGLSDIRDIMFLKHHFFSNSTCVYLVTLTL